jgi:hypothetical protein
MRQKLSKYGEGVAARWRLLMEEGLGVLARAARQASRPGLQAGPQGGGLVVVVRQGKDCLARDDATQAT